MGLRGGSGGLRTYVWRGLRGTMFYSNAVFQVEIRKEVAANRVSAKRACLSE